MNIKPVARERRSPLGLARLRRAKSLAERLAKWLAEGLAVVLAASLPGSATGAIAFQDVADSAGIVYSGPTAAASWGDFNGDGNIDLWVSNHHGIAPTLYVQTGSGAFVTVDLGTLVDGGSADWQSPNGSSPDFHGAAWADFDNDGDQDLMVVTGGGAGRGASPSHLLVNQGGRLRDQSVDLGVDYPLGRGRTPLWLDADGDGRLDLVLMNKFRDEAPSVMFLQTPDGFVGRHIPIEPGREQTTFLDWLLPRIDRLVGSELSSPPQGIFVGEEFGQLADVTNDGKPKLVAYTRPTRIFALSSQSGLEDVTESLNIPRQTDVQDAAIEDFDGDGRFDWYLVRSQPGAMDVVQHNATGIKARLVSSRNTPRGFSFRSDATITFEIHRPWMDPSDPESARRTNLLVGSHQSLLPRQPFSVAPAAAEAVDTSGDGPVDGISIRFQPQDRTWTIMSHVASIGVVVSSSTPIELLQTFGFQASKGGLPDTLLISRGTDFIARGISTTEPASACVSAAAADFDNDMDMDVYLVCTSPTQNLPNVLLENDGSGGLTAVNHAGGAQGSLRGRGNQAVAADYDGDGFVDVFVTNGNGPPPFTDGPHQLFRNQGNSNRWLEIDLQGTVSNRDGIGAVVRLEAGNKTQIRVQSGGMHSFSQDAARLHFGLGRHGHADAVTIRWPSGIVQRLENVPSNQILRVTERPESP